MRLTQKQETFCLKYFELGNASEAARIAKYSPKTAAVIGAENLGKPKIIARLAELRQIAEDATVATVLERKQVLTEIIRGRFADFMTRLTAEKLKSAALQEIKIVEFTGAAKAGGKEKVTIIKLRDPIHAIAELNKIEGIYTEGAMVNIDNRTIEIIVSSEKAKELTERIALGEGT